MSTQVSEFIGDLDAGVFEQKVSHALSDVAIGVVEYGKAGKVTLTFDLKHIEGTQQVAVSHKLNFTKPTKHGKASEENTTKTPMHVGRGGSLTLMPENQADLFTQQETPSDEENV